MRNWQKLSLLIGAAGLALGLGATNAHTQSSEIGLALIGNYRTKTFEEGAAEITAYDPGTKALFTVNGATGAVDIIDITDPTKPTLKTSLSVEEYGGPTSVDIRDGLVAVAVENGQDAGNVVFFDTAGKLLAVVPVGSLPDNVGFTPDGKKVLTANEGEPNDEYTNDPEGSVSIIDISAGKDKLAEAKAVTVGFTDFNVGGPRNGELDKTIRIFGPKASVAQDLEPEYIAISPDSKTAYVTLQENNALAIIDIDAGTVKSLVALGFKDHSVEGNGLDASKGDDKINIATYPIKGMYQPDGIKAVELGGAVYLITANEGDTRDYDGYSEEVELAELKLDPAKFPNAAELQKPEMAGELVVTSAQGDIDGDGDYEEIYVFGARSFSIWSADGKLVYDSGDQLEKITAAQYPEDFNSDNGENGSFDDRSDNKGPEPEGVEIAVIGGKTYAFIGLERISGVMVFDVSDPKAPTFVEYVNNRDFKGDPEADTAGDLGPEGLLYISPENSPNGKALLIVSNEISGSIGIFTVTK